MKVRFQKRSCFMVFLLMALLSTGCGGEKTVDVKMEETAVTEEMKEKQQEKEQEKEQTAANMFGEQTEENSTKGEPSSEGENAETLEPEFPILIEEGKLAVKSIFQSSILNPDKDFEEAADVGSIELVNQSEDYLKKADITITLADGTLLTFKVCDIPAGKTVWAFDVANTSVAVEQPYKEVACQAEFIAEYSGWDGQFQVNSEVATVELTNLTGEEQKDIKVKFHCMIEGIYFGGTSYEYSIENLAQEETAVLEVMECYFGEAETVQIIY